MERSFAETVEAWHDFYVVLGGASAAMLGLLFVAVSLRLNVFRNQQLADVRAFALQTLAGFFALVLISLVLLVPEQSPAGVGIPLLCAGIAGIVAIVSVIWLAWRLRNNG